MIVLDEIRKNLQIAIRQSSHSGADICKHIGIKQPTLSQYLSGRAMPALDTFAKLCVYLDLDANEILCISEADRG